MMCLDFELMSGYSFKKNQGLAILCYDFAWQLLNNNMSEEKREILTIDLSRRNFDDAVSSALQYKTEEQFFL